MTLSELCSTSFAKAKSLRSEVPRMALEARLRAGDFQDGNAAGTALRGLPRAKLPTSVADYAASLAKRTICLTLLAGSGSRWVRSVAEARDAGLPEARGVDPEAPRGLYPVADHIRVAYGGAGAPAAGPADADGDPRTGQSGAPGAAGSAGDARAGQSEAFGVPGRIPVAAYSIDAVDRLGKHLVVVRGWEDRIARLILEPLGISPERYSFFTQAAPYGKPLGHGDAAWQCRDLWKDADYVIANFGGDANSPLTALAALLALDALNAAGERVDFLLPAAPVDRPGYPIRFDSRGLPTSFGHAKLQGKIQTEGAGYTNVGVRVYRAAALYEKLVSIHDRFWRDGTGYDIPGNDPAGHEFALDNADTEFAAEGSSRVLACANAQELTPAKSLGEVPAFEAAIARVRSEWDEFSRTMS